jgi:23S rRNA pseudouridine955/2504/2580 synthase
VNPKEPAKTPRRMDAKLPAKAKEGVRVLSVDEGQRMDRWCKMHLPEVPYAALHKMLRKGLIRVDGKKVEASTRLRAAQIVSVKDMGAAPRDTADESSHLEGHEKEMRALLRDEKEVRSWVLYKDAQMIIINKPYGLAVQGGSRVREHLDMYLPVLQYEYDAPPKLVHRLDRDTSGVLVLARTREAAAQLQKGFANKRLRKTYLALCVGVPKTYQGEIATRMEKSVRGKDSREVMSSGKEGKPAVTRYRVREAMARKFALMELEPVTGRTHQLRVHMTELGCPILGDGKYGGASAFVRGSVEIADALHLHAWCIEIPLPEGKLLRVTAELPEHFKNSAKALNLDVM